MRPGLLWPMGCYLLKGIFNLAVGEEDADGNASNGELAEQIEYIQNASTPEELKKLYTTAFNMCLRANPGCTQGHYRGQEHTKGGTLMPVMEGVQQLTPEWLQARIGLVTASRTWAVMDKLKDPKKESAG